MTDPQIERAAEQVLAYATDHAQLTDGDPEDLDADVTAILVRALELGTNLSPWRCARLFLE